MLFSHTIDGRASWARVFCDPAAFLPLVQAIFRREGLPVPPALLGLTPGTNAVFRAGAHVVKVFAPEASGFASEQDFETERAMLHRAEALGIPAPRLCAAGEMRDAHRFFYLIMEYVEGKEAGEVLPAYTRAKKIAFARQVAGILRRLNLPWDGLPPVPLKARAAQSRRRSLLPPALASSLASRAEAYAWDVSVVTHGDITGENLLVLPDGALVLIDFADSVLAPPCYELAPLVFGLFGCDPDMAGVLSEGKPDFVEDVLNGLCLHAFGPNILLDFMKSHNLSAREIPDLCALKGWLTRRFGG